MTDNLARIKQWLQENKELAESGRSSDDKSRFYRRGRHHMASEALRFVESIELESIPFATPCAFCGNAPATETTSADDKVCKDCKQAFESALDSDESDSE